MITISKLAKQFGLSRTTLLYYEQLGLLQPQLRSASGYRYYDQAQRQILSQIQNYRQLGLSLDQIKSLFDNPSDSEQTKILKNQFDCLEQEIAKLKQQQKAIIACLGFPTVGEHSLDKHKWTEIMRGAGFSEADMRQWHFQFEKLQPEAHLQFLRSLQIGETEIALIRAWH